MVGVAVSVSVAVGEGDGATFADPVADSVARLGNTPCGRAAIVRGTVVSWKARLG